MFPPLERSTAGILLQAIGKMLPEFRHFGTDDDLTVALVLVTTIIILMVGVGLNKRRKRRQLRYHRLGKNLLFGQQGQSFGRDLFLNFTTIKNSAAVLLTDIRSLAVERGRVVGPEKHGQNIPVRNHRGVEGDLNHLGVTGFTGAHLLVSRLSLAAGKTRNDISDPLQLLEHGFHAPKAPASERRDFFILSGCHGIRPSPRYRCQHSGQDDCIPEYHHNSFLAFQTLNTALEYTHKIYLASYRWTIPVPIAERTAMRAALLCLTIVLLPCSLLAADLAPMLHTPDIHDNLVVFVHGEDIWTVPASGGLATRLTIDGGSESAPSFSPDGRQIAFTGEYDGNTDVYVMDINGGHITRVTFHPGRDQVVGWHPRSGKIMFRSARATMSRANKLYLINPDGTGLQEMIMYEAANGSFNADGTQIAYNRITREGRTWKRYQGGLAQDVWVYNLATDADTRLTDFAGTDRLPMWIGDNIYFVSDREKTLNVYVVSPSGGVARKITNHVTYDARHANAGPRHIVYEHGGHIVVLDPVTGTTKQLRVTIGADVPDVRPVVLDVSDSITEVTVASGGETALITARGEIYSVPVAEGRTVNLSHNDGARDHQAAFSPDGQTVAYLSDRDGEYGIWLQPADGSEPPHHLTHHQSGYRHTLRWSPDGSKIAFADETLRLYYVSIKSGAITTVAKADYENVDVSLHRKPISDYCWSPDSRWIAYSHMNADLLYRLYLHDVKQGTNHEVSVGGYNDFNPCFSADGRHLFFVSNRDFTPTYGDFEWEMVYKNAAGIYALTLTRDGAPVVPLPGAAVIEAKNNPAIDFDGLGQRIEKLPLPAGNYRDLRCGDNALFYLNSDRGDYNRFEFRALPARDLGAFDFEDHEAETVISGISGYELSADRNHIAYLKNGAAGVIAASERDAEHKSLDTSALRLHLTPRHEWRQIFNDAWRFERDFYYDPNMQGLDWEAMRAKYAPLVERAVCRQDIRYIIGELIGELNTSHTYSFGGDARRHSKSVNVGMLGADWQADGEFYRLARILRTSDWTDGVQPPLVRPGLDVREGDYLIAVNGEAVTTDRNLYSYFIDLGGRQVSLTFNNKPNARDARQVTVIPLRSEHTLRYQDWVEHNRQMVDTASDGKIGYLHFPDTYNGTAREFGRQFYGQTRKQGLIIDGRNNNGGLDPDIFLQRVGKQLHTYWTRRHSHPQTTPAVVTRAHLACVTNHQAGSGGDMLPMEFQMRGMGPVIGTRTWGGLVGVSQFISLIDGGGLTAPDYRVYDKDGSWIVEGRGITPDIPVELNSAEMANGHDAQLMKAVSVLLQQIEEDPRPWPQHQAMPVYK